MATLRPASERRFAAQPPEAPEPTTRTSKSVAESGVGICGAVAIVEDRTQFSTGWMLTSGDEVVKGRKQIQHVRKFCWTGGVSGTIGGGIDRLSWIYALDRRSERSGVRTAV